MHAFLDPNISGGKINPTPNRVPNAPAHIDQHETRLSLREEEAKVNSKYKGKNLRPTTERGPFHHCQTQNVHACWNSKGALKEKNKRVSVVKNFLMNVMSNCKH
jgi:hypothetical protein